MPSSRNMVAASVLSLLILAAACSGQDSAQPDIRLGPEGLEGLHYAGADLLADGGGVPEVRKVLLRQPQSGDAAEGDKPWLYAAPDPLPEHVEADLGDVKRAADGDTRTLRYGWGEVACTYAVDGRRVDLRIRVANHSDREIDGLELSLLRLNLPGRPHGAIDNDGAMGYRKVRLADGVLALCNWEVKRPVNLAYGPADAKDPDGPTAIGLSIPHEQWPHHPIATDRYFHIPGRPIPPGESDEYHVSLNFVPADAPDAELVAGLVEHVREARPMALEWDDRRPIGRLFLCHPFRRWETNPRGYLFGKGKDNNVFTEEGLAAFREGMLEYADRAVEILRKHDAQGVIIWDLEGQEYWHPMSYIGNPHEMSFISPEMERYSDEFIAKFTDAGLKVGLCIRPTEIALGVRPYARFWHRDVPEPVEHLSRKIEYCKERWGVSIFYFDSNVYPGSWDPWGTYGTKKPDPRIPWTMPTRIIEAVQKRHPDVLIIPEHENDAYHLFTPTYKTAIVDEIGCPETVRALYPRAFSCVATDPRTMDRLWDTYVRNVGAGDVLFVEGWYEPVVNYYSDGIYREAAFRREVPPIESPTADQLAELAASDSPSARYHAARMLGAAGAEPAGSVLVKLLDDEDPVVRKAAAQGLAELAEAGKASGEAPVEGLVVRLTGEEGGTGYVSAFAARALGAFGERAAGPLVELLRTDGQKGNHYAVEALGRTGVDSPEVAEVILPLLGEENRNAWLKRTACRAAGRIGMESAVEPLIACLDDKNETVAEAAVIALGEIGDARAVEPLIGLFGRKFNTWARTRIPGELNEALRKITGRPVRGAEAWRATTRPAAS